MMVPPRLAPSLARTIFLAVLVIALLAAGPGWARGATLHPTTLTVKSVPRVEGVRVVFDGRTFRTGPTGSVSIRTFSGRHSIGVLAPRSLPDGSTVRFAGWLDHLRLSHRVVTLPRRKALQQIGFVVWHSVSIRVTDLAARPVPNAYITRITLGSSLGQRFTFPPGRPPAAVPANRIVRNQGGLVAVPIRYSIREVIMDGANVVYGGSQRFFVGSSSIWTVKASLFPVRIEVRDALFGFSVGRGVRLTLPDGSSRVIELASGHAVTVSALPRATYKVVPTGFGFGLTSPVSLSKPLAVKLLLVSWADIAAAVVFAAVFLVGLPLFGGRLVRRAGVRLLTWRSGPDEGLSADEGGHEPVSISTNGQPEGMPEQVQQRRKAYLLARHRRKA